MILLLLAQETWLRPIDLERKLPFHFFVFKIFYPIFIGAVDFFLLRKYSSPFYIYSFKWTRQRVNFPVGFSSSPQEMQLSRMLLATHLLIHHSYTLCHIHFWDLMNRMYDMQSTLMLLGRHIGWYYRTPCLPLPYLTTQMGGNQFPCICK